MAVSGLENVLKNLNSEVKKIQGRTFKGMRKAGLFLQGEAQEITPVEFSPLINSAFTNTEKLGPRFVTRVGYTIDYAPFVHEMPETNSFTKPGTGPKFLERAVKSNQSQILKIIKSEADIK